MVQYKGFRRILSSPASSALFDVLLDDRPDFRKRVASWSVYHLPGILPRRMGNMRPYLNVGHTGLDDPGFRRWLDWCGVSPIYMVHDLIPISHPEYARQGEAEKHVQRIKTVLETATGIIGNSTTTLNKLTDWGSSRQLPSPPQRAIWLGTTVLKAKSQSPAGDPYFVVLGTIEGRKNHLLLLNLWLNWIESGRMPVARLYIVGQRGWSAEKALAMLDQCDALRSYVVELNHCSDAALADLIGNARALVFPSLAEGYGMPLAEAMMACVPVIASDLPVFREIAGELPTYCDPLDSKSWEEAILSFTPRHSEPRARQCAALTHYKGPTWADHFQQVDGWLEELDLI
ncbi:glycosyltransferase family 4 protein [Sphingomonas paeninsulae]|uniref:glycosyltransferase family 4 protein n=1 Tax=Sphingomonas paeninsulae TaxID=2319844 RepID=UPI001EF020E4|nr:glycosyltransferase family 1 protein [Sphingomonas paeninsulae]